MDALHQRRWLGAAILFGIVYLLIGIAFGKLANASSDRARETWRLGAWLVSAIVFSGHIAYEHFRRRCSPPATALHVSVAVALAAFGLAVAANVHAQRAASGHRGLLAFALVAWPALTGVPAFLVAFVAATVLARMRRRG